MNAVEARTRFAGARVARLATIGADGRPHVVPVCFAVAGDSVYTAVDAKPKRTRALQRVANVARDPRVTLLADHYEDADWSALWWVRAEGEAAVREPDTEAIELLAGRYAQYREQPPRGPLLVIRVRRWTGWAAARP